MCPAEKIQTVEPLCAILVSKGAWAALPCALPPVCGFGFPSQLCLGLWLSMGLDPWVSVGPAPRFWEHSQDPAGHGEERNSGEKGNLGMPGAQNGRPALRGKTGPEPMVRGKMGPELVVRERMGPEPVVRE